MFLFDEPLSDLDAKLRVQMRIEIRRLHDRSAVTSVSVTHDQTEAMTLADKLVVLNAGRVEQVGTPGEICRRPASRFVAGFVGSPATNLVEAEASGPDAVAFGPVTIPTPPHGLARGTPVCLGFRPEDAAPVPGGMEDAVPVAVGFIEDLGAFRLLHGRLGGASAVVQVPASQWRGLGPLWLRVSREAVHRFDAGTGRRVAPHEDRAAA